MHVADEEEDEEEDEDEDDENEDEGDAGGRTDSFTALAAGCAQPEQTAQAIYAPPASSPDAVV